MSDYWSTVIKTVTFIGFGFKNPVNFGLVLLAQESEHFIFRDTLQYIAVIVSQLSIFVPSNAVHQLDKGTLDVKIL